MNSKRNCVDRASDFGRYAGDDDEKYHDSFSEWVLSASQHHLLGC